VSFFLAFTITTNFGEVLVKGHVCYRSLHWKRRQKILQTIPNLSI